MGKRVSDSTEERLKALMFKEFTGTSEERFLQQELARYVPQLAGRSNEEVGDFINYQRQIYLQGRSPIFGRPIASLNPTFVDSIDSSIMNTIEDMIVYARASVKANGYRIQLHRGLEKPSAFTRQFTRYDLGMFPELTGTIERLPVIIADGELVSANYVHLAGFNRVQERIPNQTFWPREGEDGLGDEKLSAYLSNPKFFSAPGIVVPDLEMSLVFHGLFAISDPSTWDKSREIQMKNLINLCKLPVNYKVIDEYLDLLNTYLLEQSLNASVIDRYVAKNIAGLKGYIKKNDDDGQEGTCIVRTFFDQSGNPILCPKSIKIKKYETLDCALLGLYLLDSSLGFVEENISGALVGLYDQALGVYLAVTKVNLDPNGIQVKTTGQKERLVSIRKEIALLKTSVVQDVPIFTLYDVFMMQGKLSIKYLFDSEVLKDISFEQAIESLPARQTMIDIFNLFSTERKSFCDGIAKHDTVVRKYIAKNLKFFEAIYRLDAKGKERFVKYFSMAKEIKTLSAKLVKPQIIFDQINPIIIETQVFDIKWGGSPYPAGFHSWFGNSFRFNNSYPERVRHDKNTTTDYGTVYFIARINTPR